MPLQQLLQPVRVIGIVWVDVQFHGMKVPAEEEESFG